MTVPDFSTRSPLDDRLCTRKLENSTPCEDSNRYQTLIIARVETLLDTLRAIADDRHNLYIIVNMITERLKTGRWRLRFSARTSTATTR
ncbi:hypothetical protein KCU95_g96, partial [Aureobasidium melanogenum]